MQKAAAKICCVKLNIDGTPVINSGSYYKVFTTMIDCLKNMGYNKEEKSKIEDKLKDVSIATGKKIKAVSNGYKNQVDKLMDSCKNTTDKGLNYSKPVRDLITFLAREAMENTLSQVNPDITSESIGDFKDRILQEL